MNRLEAIRAAHHDSSWLISPKARHRALIALDGDYSGEAEAARAILNDGGVQQGGEHPRGGFYISVQFTHWKECADILEDWYNNVYLRDIRKEMTHGSV